MSMSADTRDLDALLQGLTPGNRQKLGRTLAMAIRTDSAKSIRQNIDADGNRMSPRKKQKRRDAKKGKMFKRLGRANSMRVRASSRNASVDFKKWWKIAKTNHFGETIKMPNGANATYPVRTLLGWNPKRMAIVEKRILEHFSQQK